LLFVAVVGAGRTGWNDPMTSFPYIDRYAEFLGEPAQSPRS